MMNEVITQKLKHITTRRLLEGETKFVVLDVVRYLGDKGYVELFIEIRPGIDNSNPRRLRLWITNSRGIRERLPEVISNKYVVKVVRKKVKPGVYHQCFEVVENE